MINLRTRCIYALIVTTFLTAIAIIEFVIQDNPLWRDVARFLVFPLLAALLAVFIIAILDHLSLSLYASSTFFCASA